MGTNFDALQVPYLIKEYSGYLKVAGLHAHKHQHIGISPSRRALRTARETAQPCNACHPGL